MHDLCNKYKTSHRKLKNDISFKLCEVFKITNSNIIFL